MIKRHIDFFAIAFIALAMLGLARLKSLSDSLDSIQIENAIDIHACPSATEVLSNIALAFR